MHVVVVEVDQIAECTHVPDSAWFGGTVAVDVALHLERPPFTVLAPAEGLGHISRLAADLDAPVS